MRRAAASLGAAGRSAADPRAVAAILVAVGGSFVESHAVPPGAAAPEVRVGSKSFTESVVLGEIAVALARDAGARVVHVRELGGTQVLWKALLAGEIDVYPEYTGTIVEEILGGESAGGETADSGGRPESGDPIPDETLRARLAERRVHMSRPLGFDNTYAIGMREEVAGRLGVRRISDLRAHPDLVLGFSNEFMDRGDGWPALRERYALPQEARGIDHDLAYRGLESGSIHATDLYSTDAEIRFYGLRALEDDLGHFPAYRAVWLARADLETRAPAVAAALARMEARIDAAAMREMNSRAKLEKVPEARVAADFLAEALGVRVELRDETRIGRILRRTREHLVLVGVSVFAAILVAIPLGILAARRPRIGRVVLGASGILQTIPSLALLVLLIPVLGIGAPPAIAALFLYGLLPIVRNVATGLGSIPGPLLESADALGLSPRERLRLVEIPLASPAILAGIRTSAVIAVGTATLGALVGAGGYGQTILTGIRLADPALLLEGALPAAALALLVEAAFEGLERVVVPRGLRLARRE